MLFAETPANHIPVVGCQESTPLIDYDTFSALGFYSLRFGKVLTLGILRLREGL